MKSTLALLAFLLFFSASQAQIKDRLQINVAFYLEFIPVTIPKTNISFFQNSTPNFYALSGGVNYVLLHSNDMFSLGVNGNLHLGLSFYSGSASVLVQTPIYLTAKVGANATKFNENKIGFSVGLGPNFTYARIPIASNNTIIGALSAPYFAPCAMAEVSFHLWGRITSVRGHANLMRIPVGDPKSSNFLNTELDYYNWGFGLLHYF